MRELLSNVVGKVYDEGYVDLNVYPRGLFDDSLDNPISRTRDEILWEISGLAFNENTENVNLIEYDGSLNKTYGIYTRFIKRFREKDNIYCIL